MNFEMRTVPQLCLSREAKAKAHCAYNEATVAPLASTTLLASVKPTAREVKTRAPVRARSIADLASLSAPSAKILCRRLEVKHD